MDFANVPLLLEKRFLPRLKIYAAVLREKHPEWKISALSHPVGAETSYQGHTAEIACLLPDAPPGRVDNVALQIETCHLDRRPRINGEVTWGNLSGYVEVEFSVADSNDDWPELTNEVLDQLDSFLPELFAGLDAALSRCGPRA